MGEELSSKAISIARTRELLMRHGVPAKQALNVAMNELRGWNIQEVEDIMAKVSRPNYGHCPLKTDGSDPDESFLQQHFGFILPPAWVKPPLSLIRRAVEEKRILCVNKSFEWRLLDGKYMAVSHVWAEGIRADPKGRGLTRQHLSRIFDVVSRAGGEWIWLDVLSVPNADPYGENLSQEEKRLQTEVINTLPQVYEQADAVVVLDALLLQMHTSAPLDVAVGLVCGTWTQRVWTYQEIRLAKKALILTAESVVTLDDIRSDLSFRCRLFESLVSDRTQKSQFSSLALSMNILQYVGNVGISLTDISFASATRQSTQQIDYARAVFALLGLEWDGSWTSHEQGTQKIYEARRADAARLVAMSGVKRMSVPPRWAPSRLTGLEGRIEGSMVWEPNGLKGSWYKERITEIFRKASRGRRRVVNLMLQGGAEAECWCQVIVGEDEDSETIEAFEKAVAAGRAFILCQHQFSANSGFEMGTASQALVVEEVGISGGEEELEVPEFDVLFAVALAGVVGDSRANQITVVLRH